MTTVDLLVVGGGINGVAIALDAAARGLRVWLVEQQTIGSGTSSKTSKLAHGGLRYLEQLQFKVVRESLRERDTLLDQYPQFVKPMPFVVPVYGRYPWPAWKLGLGLTVYDFLAKKHRLPGHERLTPMYVSHRFAGLNAKGLTAGFRYFDAQMDDLGLLKFLAKRAESLGVMISEYCYFEGPVFEQGRVVGGRLSTRDGSFDFKAKMVVQAMGPWSPGVKPSKGVHLVLPAMPFSEALLLAAPQDGRVFFVIPWEGKTLVGTTETAYSGLPELVRVEPEDVAYLMQAFHHYFPTYFPGESSIFASFAGVRPLVDPGVGGLGSASRDFQLDRSVPGMLRVFGGKYTTHRVVAEQVVNEVVRQFSKEGAWL